MALSARNLLLVLGSVVVVAAGGVYFFVNQPEASAIPASGAAPTAVAAAGDELMVAGPLGEKALGDPNAKVTVIEYASMTCPHCATFHQTTYPELKKRYIDTGKVRFIFREFPLDQLALAVFMLARCAGPYKYFPMIETLFQQQKEWVTQKPLQPLLAIARQAGMSEQAFNECLQDKKLIDGIEDVRQRAMKLNVQSTPSFFVNGKPMRGSFSIEEFEKQFAPYLKG